MRWSRGFLRCFGAHDDDDEQQSAQVLGGPTNPVQETRRRIGRAAVGRTAKPWNINVCDVPDYISASASPASIFALDQACVLTQVHDSHLAAMLECVFVNAQAQKLLGTPTLQAYHRMVFDQLVSVEELLLVELRDVLLSLLDPSSQQGCYCPLIAVGGVGPGPNLWPTPNNGTLCRSCRRDVARRGHTAGSEACSSGAESDSGDDDNDQGTHNDRPCTCNTFNATAMTAAALGLEGLRLHPCWIEDTAPSTASTAATASAAGQPASRRPGVILWHRQPLRWRHGRAVALRSLCMLTHLDHAVTLLSPAGRVLYQNTASRRYYGRLVGLPPSSLPAAPPPPANNDGSIGRLTSGTALGSARCHGSAAQLPGPVAEEESGEGEEPGAADADRGCRETSGVAPPQLQLRRALTVADPGMLWAGAPEALLRELSCCQLVRHLFSCDVPELVQDMLGSWATGKPWKHLLQVPSPACDVRSPSTQLKGLRWQPPEPLPSLAGRGTRARPLCAATDDMPWHAPFVRYSASARDERAYHSASPCGPIQLPDHIAAHETSKAQQPQQARSVQQDAWRQHQQQRQPEQHQHQHQHPEQQQKQHQQQVPRPFGGGGYDDCGSCDDADTRLLHSLLTSGGGATMHLGGSSAANSSYLPAPVVPRLQSRTGVVVGLSPQCASGPAGGFTSGLRRGGGGGTGVIASGASDVCCVMGTLSAPTNAPGGGFVPGSVGLRPAADAPSVGALAPGPANGNRIVNLSLQGHPDSSSSRADREYHHQLHHQEHQQHQHQHHQHHLRHGHNAWSSSPSSRLHDRTSPSRPRSHAAFPGPHTLAGTSLAANPHGCTAPAAHTPSTPVSPQRHPQPRQRGATQTLVYEGVDLAPRCYSMDGQAWGAGLHRLGRRAGLGPLGWVHGAEEERASSHATSYASLNLSRSRPQTEVQPFGVLEGLVVAPSEEDPLAMSAWRAALKVSASRRSLELQAHAFNCTPAAAGAAAPGAGPGAGAAGYTGVGQSRGAGNISPGGIASHGGGGGGGQLLRREDGRLGLRREASWRHATLSVTGPRRAPSSRQLLLNSLELAGPPALAVRQPLSAHELPRPHPLQPTIDGPALQQQQQQHGAPSPGHNAPAWSACAPAASHPRPNSMWPSPATTVPSSPLTTGPGPFSPRAPLRSNSSTLVGSGGSYVTVAGPGISVGPGGTGTGISVHSPCGSRPLTPRRSSMELALALVARAPQRSLSRANMSVGSTAGPPPPLSPGAIFASGDCLVGGGGGGAATATTPGMGVSGGFRNGMLRTFDGMSGVGEYGDGGDGYGGGGRCSNSRGSRHAVRAGAWEQHERGSTMGKGPAWCSVGSVDRHVKDPSAGVEADAVVVQESVMRQIGEPGAAAVGQRASGRPREKRAEGEGAADAASEKGWVSGEWQSGPLPPAQQQQRSPPAGQPPHSGEQPAQGQAGDSGSEAEAEAEMKSALMQFSGEDCSGREDGATDGELWCGAFALAQPPPKAGNQLGAAAASAAAAAAVAEAATAAAVDSSSGRSGLQAAAPVAAAGATEGIAAEGPAVGAAAGGLQGGDASGLAALGSVSGPCPALQHRAFASLTFSDSAAKALREEHANAIAAAGAAVVSAAATATATLTAASRSAAAALAAAFGSTRGSRAALGSVGGSGGGGSGPFDGLGTGTGTGTSYSFASVSLLATDPRVSCLLQDSLATPAPGGRTGTAGTLELTGGAAAGGASANTGSSHRTSQLNGREGRGEGSVQLGPAVSGATGGSPQVLLTPVLGRAAGANRSGQQTHGTPEEGQASLVTLTSSRQSTAEAPKLPQQQEGQRRQQQQQQQCGRGGVARACRGAPAATTAAASAAPMPLLEPLHWHEVAVAPFNDPVTGQRMLLVQQTDVTARVEAERRLVELTAAQTGMLESMFPRHVLEFLVDQGETVGAVDFSAHLANFATTHDIATVLFTDIVGFTSMSKQVPAAAVMAFLSELYSRLDALVDEHGVWKVETAGDCYIVAAGVVQPDHDGFQAVVTNNFTAGPRQLSRSGTASQPTCSSSLGQSTPTTQPVDAAGLHMQSPGHTPEGLYSAATATAVTASTPNIAPGDLSVAPTSNFAPTTASSTAAAASMGAAAAAADPDANAAAAASSCHSAGPGDGSGGAPQADALSVFQFAVAMMRAARHVCMPHDGQPVQLRVGIHSGPLVSGVIGTKMPKFALFGDTMNTASRMESTSKPGLIQVSAATRALLPEWLALEPTGGVEVKGKGVMQTFLFQPNA